jgi:DNA ligase-1
MQRYLEILKSINILGPEHLKEFCENIISKGGEGVVLRESQSLYKVGRSESLRKFKPFFDAEVKVVENNCPHGFNCLQYEKVFVFFNFF